MPWTIEYTETALTQLRKLDKRTARRIVASSMNAKQLLTHFDRIADAPDAIPRLRRFILDLAVRGKLVEQDQNEGTGSSLLTEIERGQAAHVSSRRLKKTHKLEGLSFSDVPFQVPENWALVRLGQTLDLVNGRAFKPSDWTQTGLPIVRIQNLNNPFAAFNHYDGEVKEKFLIDSGDFLISWSGTPGTSFGAHIWMGGPAVLNQHIFKAILIGNAFEPHFLKLAINARLFELIEQAHGGVGLQHITKPKLEAVVLTLPPLAEQHHIVAKVDELMALCDRLETARKEREATRDRLAAASLARLNAPDPDPAVFQNHAAFALDNLISLTTRPDQIKALRQTVLNLAVRGQLVEQDPEDDPASELVKQAHDSMSLLVESGEAVRMKAMNPLIKADELFPVPKSWQWVRLGELSKLITKGSSPKWQGIEYVDEESGILFITSENVGNYTLTKMDKPKYVEARFNQIESRSILQKGDILLNLVGASIGRSAVFNLECTANINQAVALIRPIHENVHIVSSYLLHYLNSPVCINEMLGSRVINAQPNISLTDTRNFLVPLPPLAEQHRIVAKVNELIARCDRLEASLAAGEEARGRLVEALLHETLATGRPAI